MSSASFKVVSVFGLDGCLYKLLIQSYRTGNRFLIWYYDQVGLQIGEEAIITADSNWDYWYSISNPRTGRDSNISRWNKVS
jgi:hypothetical protein